MDTWNNLLAGEDTVILFHETLKKPGASLFPLDVALPLA